jgi:exodeoxyribonuclease V alpha subunit
MSTTWMMRIQRVRGRSGSSTTASALEIDAAGTAIADAPRYAAVFPARLTPVDVMPGQWWRLAGTATPLHYVVDGYMVHEHRVVVESAELLRPSGDHIVQLLSSSPAFPGIGEVKARRLWDALGERLYHALDTADRDAIAAVIGVERADVLLDGWKQFGTAEALVWFQRVGLDLRLSRRALEIYGAEAHTAIAQDPYRLLAFGMTWSAVDRLAREHIGLEEDDPRRLMASVEDVLYAVFDGGSTCCERTDVARRLRPMIGAAAVDMALELAVTNRIACLREGRLHAQGPYLIERGVAEALSARLGVDAPLIEPEAVERLLQVYEREAVASAGVEFRLNPAQRAAVQAVARRPLALITGGAGVGKTTVLTAVCRLLDECRRPVYLMALSGRAAKRITEATGRTAMTIAGFLRNVAPDGISDNAVLVVDEASMLDVVSCYRLLQAIPSACRLVLIGDPAQLPPVGPGLTLHALVAVSRVPCVELTEVRRFGGDIARGTQAVREGRWPTMPVDQRAPLAFVRCAERDIAPMVVRLYLEDPQRTQILTYTRDHGPASAKTLNALCQEAVGGQAQRLQIWSDERQRVEDSGLRVGDAVLCTRNLWDIGIQNGSLGRITAIEPVQSPPPDEANDSADIAVASVRWDDGEVRPVTEVVLDALELGYAVTVHKAQGSQFPRVIVPVWPARNLDRTMLYTAMTRATAQVLLVGDEEVARQAVIAPPHASQRQVTLASLMEELCSSP